MFSHSAVRSLSLFLISLFCLQLSSVLGSPTTLLNGDLPGRDSLVNLESRIIEAANAPLTPRNLFKRQCVLSDQKNKNGISSGNAMANLNIDSAGYAKGRITMFYTKLGKFPQSNGSTSSRVHVGRLAQFIPNGKSLRRLFVT